MVKKSKPPTLVPEDGEIRPPDENNIGTSIPVKQNKDEHISVTETLDGAALQILRGVSRYFRMLDCAVLSELPLADGRRCDVMALDPRGGVTIVEIKSGVADFRSDQKWPDYRQWCDRFFFAVDIDFPQELIPADCGLIIADRFGAELMREAPDHPLTGARRKAVMLRFARCSAFRLHETMDPESRPVI